MAYSRSRNQLACGRIYALFPNSGYLNARKAISDYLKRRYGVSYSPDGELLITVGGSEGLDLVARALINPGDEVIVVEPCFVAYNATVKFVMEFRSRLRQSLRTATNLCRKNLRRLLQRRQST